MGIEYVADQRHGELLVRDLDLAPANALTTPGIKRPASDYEDEELQEGLSPPEATQYRALAARANYLAADRPDIQFAAKEICRRMSAPVRQDWAALQHLGRYLKGKPRSVVLYKWQNNPTVNVYCDSDCAGCVRTRRSTSGGVTMLGTHVVKTWSNTQGPIALSSGEAEYYSLIRAAAAGMGMQGILVDLGIGSSLVVHSDLSAALGIAKRSGLGKTRHIAVHLLWIQDKVRNGNFVLEKVLGTKNPADLLTKHLATVAMKEHIDRMGFTFVEGRSKEMPDI